MVRAGELLSRIVLDNPKLTQNEATKTLWDFYESAKSPNLNGFPNSIYINEYLQALNEETERALKLQISAQEAMDNVVKKMQPVADKAKNKRSMERQNESILPFLNLRIGGVGDGYR